jgi:hypothetical protein
MTEKYVTVILNQTTKLGDLSQGLPGRSQTWQGDPADLWCSRERRVRRGKAERQRKKTLTLHCSRHHRAANVDHVVGQDAQPDPALVSGRALVTAANSRSDAATLEQARSLAKEAMFTVAPRRRPIRSNEPEDEVF